MFADQSPGLLDMSVIRNTNTKIILRLPDQSDRELVGYAAGLKKDQIGELAKLEREVAAIYQNDWVEPVLAQVNKCELKEVPYSATIELCKLNESQLKKQLLFLLIQGRVVEKLDFNVSYIEQGISLLNLSSQNRDIVENQILEYKETSSLSLWSDKRFHKLSHLVTILLDAQLEVERCVVTAIAVNNLS